MEIDVSKIPYKHRFAAASLLMSKGNRLTELMAIATDSSRQKRLKSVLEGLSYYDMALSLMKRMDPNYQTLLNWKCLALISIGQFKDARHWYEELVAIARESEGPNCLGATAQLAIDQLALLADKDNEALPEIDRSDVEVFDDPPFCAWAERFCWLLRDRKYNVAHRCLSASLQQTLTPADLKTQWSSVVGRSKSGADIVLERFEWSPASENSSQAGWCYFSITSDEFNEAISMSVYKTPANGFEIGSLEFGRP